MKKFVFIFLILSIYNISFSQGNKIVIKFKKDIPQNIILEFKSGNIKSQNNSFAKLCSLLNINDANPLVDDKFKIINSDEYGLKRIFVCNINFTNAHDAISLLKTNEYIEYAELIGKRKLERSSIVPNDPYYQQQYYLQLTNSNSCWDLTMGDSSIVIGVVDSGLDFLHPDLQNSFKINFGEFGNGKENNGIDDDNDGYIDNYRGWNFIGNNNDPTDDNLYSHGTSVAGIISAGFNNGIGISSIAPNSKVLVIKAFDVNGFGEDDKIASAILYGVMKGVKIFNFSFGDYVYSNLLRDVIKYAYSKNIIMLCSAGNDGSDQLHYPSAFDEVISVGASTSSDSRAGFSSFGETVDLFAPGSMILTTSIRGKGETEFNNDYHFSSGTSFSSPIVAAIASLILSKNKNLTNEEVRGILVGSTDFFPSQYSWNHLYSSGRLNSFASLNNYNKPSIARIFFPFQNLSSTQSSIPFYLSAASSYFNNYSVSYGIGENPASFTNIFAISNNQVIKDTVGFWNITNLPDTSLTVRLSISTSTGKTIEHRQIIFKDNSSPVIIPLEYQNVVEKNNFIGIYSFYTAKLSIGKIYYRPSNSNEEWKYIYANYGSPNIAYYSKSHYGIFDNKTLIPNVQYDAYLEAISENGLRDSSGIIIISLYPEFSQYDFVQKNYSLPNSQTNCPVTDLSGNNNSDVFINLLKNNLQLEAYEFQSNGFQKISNNNWGSLFVARDVIKLPGNINLLLTNKGRNGEVYKSSTTNFLPSELFWTDEGNDNFWSSRFADCDNDGIHEIIGFGKTGLRILEYNGTGYSSIANLTYTYQNEESNSQNVLVNDFDSDGKKEIIFTGNYVDGYGTQNTEILVYRCTGNNNFEKVYTESVTGNIRGDNFCEGDIDFDNRSEIIIGIESAVSEIVPGFNVLVFKLSSNRLNYFNNLKFYTTQNNFQISTKSSNLDGLPGDEISINYGKYFYVTKYQNQFLKPVTCKKGINSYSQLIYDFDKNNINEIGLNTENDTLLFFEMNTNISRPQVPLGFIGYSADSNKVILNFNQVTGANYYKIYRAQIDSTSNYVLIDSTLTNSYFDINVVNHNYYFYKISAVNNSFTVKESLLSDAVKVFVHNKSKLISAEYQKGGFMIAKFSEKVSLVIPSIECFVFNNNLKPNTVSFYNDYSYLLSFKTKFNNGIYNIKTNNLKDNFGSPVDTNQITFSVNESDTNAFYIKNASIIDNKKIKIEFNFNVDHLSVKNPSNYVFTPFNFTVAAVDIDPQNSKIIFITLSGSGNIGASGKTYYLKISNIFSENGIKITEGAGSSYSFIFVKEDLENVLVYPNPYTSKSSQNYITFANLTKTATIYIYDISGNFINRVEETDGNGGVEWNLKDVNGKDIPTGIYIYRATGKNSNNIEVEDKIGKFAIVR